jgi:predicted nucleic acid-binding protein
LEIELFALNTNDKQQVTTEQAMRVVFDTSVLVAAAHSRRGASFALVSAIPSSRFQICLSIGLYAEWQDALTRLEHLPPGQTIENTLGFLKYLASQAWLQDIFFLWRPFLPDPDDDMILELAFAANCPYIVTHNVRDFAGCEQLGISAVTPRDFFKIIAESP